MKKLDFILAAICLLFAGCNAEQFIEMPDEPTCQDPTSRALSYLEPSVSNPTLHSDWENVTTIVLNSGASIHAPWVILPGNNMNVPDDYRTDIKKEDGWTMLSHTMIDTPTAEPNYMLFYNKYSGFFKGFYYSPTGIKNKSLIWVMEAREPTSLFPSNTLIQGTTTAKYQYITTSNILEESLFNFGQLEIGWNAFSFEFFYGTSANNPVVHIKGYHTETSHVTMGGSFSGEVIMTVPKEEKSFLGKMVNMLGKVTKTGSKIIPQLNTINKAVTAAGTILGKTSLYKTTGTTTIRGTTSGTIQLTGDIFSEYAGTVQSANNIPLNQLNNGQALGVWGFNKNPQFKYNKYIQMDQLVTEIGAPRIFRGTVRPTLDINSHIVLNPAISGMVSHVRVVDTQFYYLKKSGYSFPVEQVTDDCYFITKLDFERQLVNSGSTDPTKMLFYYTSQPPTITDVYATVTVEIRYNDGNILTSSRTFKSDFIMVDNRSSISDILNNPNVQIIWL